MFKEGRKKKNEKTQREQTENKKGSVDLSPIISIITINRKGINTSIKGQRLEEWIKIYDPIIRCLLEIHLRSKDTNRLKLKGCKKIFHANCNQKRARVATLISYKIDLIEKKYKRQ